MAVKKTKGSELRLRVVASVLIVWLHLMMGLWLAQNRVVPSTAQSPVIDIDLSPGPGIGSGPVALASTEASDTTDASPPVHEPENTASETSSQSTTTDFEPVAEQTETTPSEVVSTVEPPIPTTSLNADVLTQVEALIGTTAADLSVNTAQIERSNSEAWIASQPGGGGGCQINETIRSRLMADRTAVEELVSYPIAQRSVSNAIQLWNGEWLAASTGDATSSLVVVRRVIAATVSEAPEDCQRELMQGPRFVFVTPPEAMPIILVIGSGEWQWADLATSEPPNFLRWFGIRPRER